MFKVWAIFAVFLVQGPVEYFVNFKQEIAQFRTLRKKITSYGPWNDGSPAHCKGPGRVADCNLDDILALSSKTKSPALNILFHTSQYVGIAFRQKYQWRHLCCKNQLESDMISAKMGLKLIDGIIKIQRHFEYQRTEPWISSYGNLPSLWTLGWVKIFEPRLQRFTDNKAASGAERMALAIRDNFKDMRMPASLKNDYLRRIDSDLNVIKSFRTNASYQKESMFLEVIVVGFMFVIGWVI